MPTYDYECSKCNRTFEIFQNMSDDTLTDCPDEKCGGKSTLKRVIGGGAGLIFKGTGFYQTDYKKSQCSSTPCEAKAESKPAQGACGSECCCSKK